MTRPAARALLAALVVVAAGCASTSGDNTDTAAGGPDQTTTRAHASAPASLVAIDGTTVSLQDGTPTVLYFMSTDVCASCEEGAVALEDYRKSHTGALQIVGVEVIPAMPQSEVASFGERLALNYPLAIDDGALTESYGVLGISVATILGPDGIVVAEGVNPLDTTALDDAVSRAS